MIGAAKTLPDPAHLVLVASAGIDAWPARSPTIPLAEETYSVGPCIVGVRSPNERQWHGVLPTIARSPVCTGDQPRVTRSDRIGTGPYADRHDRHLR